MIPLRCDAGHAPETGRIRNPCIRTYETTSHSTIEQLTPSIYGEGIDATADAPQLNSRNKTAWCDGSHGVWSAIISMGLRVKIMLRTGHGEQRFTKERDKLDPCSCRPAKGSDVAQVQVQFQQHLVCDGQVPRPKPRRIQPVKDAPGRCNIASRCYWRACASAGRRYRWTSRRTAGAGDQHGSRNSFRGGKGRNNILPFGYIFANCGVAVAVSRYISSPVRSFCSWPARHGTYFYAVDNVELPGIILAETQRGKDPARCSAPAPRCCRWNPPRSIIPQAFLRLCRSRWRAHWPRCWHEAQ